MFKNRLERCFVCAPSIRGCFSDQSRNILVEGYMGFSTTIIRTTVNKLIKQNFLQVTNKGLSAKKPIYQVGYVNYHGRPSNRLTLSRIK